MPNHGNFPIWTRGRAERHRARGCSSRFLSLIFKPAGKRATAAASEQPTGDAPRSNILPFRIPDASKRLRSLAAAGPGLRQA